MYNDTFGYESKLPDNIREIFMWLCEDVASLHGKWSFYMELFGGEESTALLSELAPASFQIIEESLRDDMAMAIYRLSDPPQSMRQDNLSLNTLDHRLGELDNATELFREYLFSVETRFADELNNGRVSAELQEQFQGHGIALDPQSRIEVNQVGNIWTIVSANNEYMISKENQSLSVYYQTLNTYFRHFREACEPVRRYRNKRVGHNDLNTRIKPHENLLPGLGRQHIDRILELAEKILNVVCQRFVNCERNFDPVQFGGADALIFSLKMAKEYETAKRNALLGNAA